MFGDEAGAAAVAGLHHLAAPGDAGGKRLFDHDHFDAGFGGFDDGMMVVERVGGDVDDVETGFFVHVDGGGIAMLGFDLPFIAELLEPLRVDVGDCDQLGVFAAAVAGCVGEGSVPESADWAGADDADSDFSFRHVCAPGTGLRIWLGGDYGSSAVMGMM